MRRLSAWLPIALVLLACTPAPQAPPPLPAQDLPAPARTGTFTKPCRCNPNGSVLCDGWVVVRFALAFDVSPDGQLVDPKATQSCGADELRELAVKRAKEMAAVQERELVASAAGGGHVELLIQFNDRAREAGERAPD